MGNKKNEKIDIESICDDMSKIHEKQKSLRYRSSRYYPVSLSIALFQDLFEDQIIREKMENRNKNIDQLLK